MKSRMLQATCLKPRYSLRYQLFVSFGVSSAIAIGVVVLVATLTAKSSGESVKTQARELLRTQVIANTRASSEHAADTLSKKFENIEGVVSLLGELTKDRIVGFPSQDWQNDAFVPFFDTVSGTNVYPIVTEPLPPDWNITVNVNPQNYHEHVQDRWDWYVNNYPMSTASAAYRIQGACDPDETNPKAPTYYENCTTANNDFSTGGVVQPTEFSQQLADKAADLAVFLKPLYETHSDVKHVGIYFGNSGAGSSLVYPGYHINGTSSYVSGGCDWMREINSNTGLPYGTEQEIARCHPNGTRVPGREYNPLERQWCRDQALNPYKTEIVGPYLDAFISDLWLLTVGKAIFDRMTGHFLGCTLLDVSISHIADILSSVQVNDFADIALLRWDDGTVVFASQWNTSNTVETIHAEDLHFCDKRTFHNLQALVDFEKFWDASEWNATEIKERFRENTYNENGQLLAALPIPDPPEEYDPSYRPEFIVIQAVGEEIYGLINEMEASIDEDIVWLYVATISIGCVGLTIVLLVSWIVAVYLTRPLNWMMDVCQRIVHHSREKSDDSIYGDEEEKPLIRCTPKTEITALVSEFQSIIENFSGNGPATVASPDVHAVLNKLNWQEDFGAAYLEQLYDCPMMMDEIGQAERRLSFVSSVASHQSTATLLDIDDEMSGDGTDVDETAAIITGMSAVAEAQAEVIGEQPLLESMPTLSVEPDEINVTSLEEKKQAATGPQVEVKMPERPPHLFSCSEANRANKGYITTAVIDDAGAGCFENELRSSIKRNRILHSPLFWWIMGLIVVPVLLTMTLICTIVIVNVTTVLPSWLDKAEVVSIALEEEYVTESAASHAALTQEIFVPLISDLHLLTRITGWLAFRGVVMAASFSDMTQGTEECKTFPNNGSCPFFLDPNRASCDCRWNDPHATTCQTYDNPRARQKQHFSGQAQDADPETGARTITSFPAVDYSPSSTLWWDDTTNMPGYSNGTLAQGYATVFDRTRVMSATSTVSVALYNYRVGGSNRKHLGIYIGWEADGMLSGYGGCGHVYAHYSHFRSTPENGASKISPELCPLWKYGYDSRCRGWYDEGKRANGLHLTAPYVFAATKEVANSVTFPLVDPETGAHVGQTLLDFLPVGLPYAATADNRHTNGFFILVTPESDALGGDTLTGHGYSWGSSSPRIQDLVMPCDKPSSENRRLFEMTLLASMKEGNSNETSFRRQAFVRDGETLTCREGKEESMFIAIRPIAIRESKPLRHDDFARGVNASDVHMGFLWYVVPKEDLAAPFKAIEDQVDDDINRSISIFIGLIAATAAIVTGILATVSDVWVCFFSLIDDFSLLIILDFHGHESKVTISIVKPVTILLEFVKIINKKHSIYDIPQMKGGSREVNQVYTSLTKLYHILRLSNMAFFSGKLQSAYRLLVDALSLFQRADDQKAIGIASNNLGNTLLAIRNQKLSTKSCFRIDGNCVQRQALESYNEAILSSTSEYEQSLDTDSGDLSAKLAEQLANRYFNRGLFFLITADDACAESDFAERGRRDLLHAAELDAEVRSLWVETRQVHKNSVRYFERLLRRADGLIGLMQKGILETGSWNVAELLEEADSLLFVVWNVPGSPLFDALTPIGRLQQLEGAAIRYALCRGSTQEAARLSTRMLVEDEFIGELPLSAAASAYLSWFRESPPPVGLRKTEVAIRRDLRRMLKSSKIASESAVERNIALFQDIADQDDCTGILRMFVQKLSNSCCDDDFVIMPSQGDSDTESMLSVQRKADMEESEWSEGCEGRRIKDVNVDFRRVIHIVLESGELSENDTWIILTTDRIRWDSAQCLLSESHHYVLSEIAQFNKTRSAAFHVAIVSMGASSNMSEICSEVCRVSRESLYIDLQGGAELLDDALAEVASLVIGGGKRTCSVPCGITMEKF